MISIALSPKYKKKDLETSRVEKIDNLDQNRSHHQIKKSIKVSKSIQDFGVRIKIDLT